MRLENMCIIDEFSNMVRTDERILKSNPGLVQHFISKVELECKETMDITKKILCLDRINYLNTFLSRYSRQELYEAKKKFQIRNKHTLKNMPVVKYWSMRR
jgi:hypothetical protein